jgi:hypothetical protein
MGKGFDSTKILEKTAMKRVSSFTPHKRILWGCVGRGFFLKSKNALGN